MKCEMMLNDCCDVKFPCLMRTVENQPKDMEIKDVVEFIGTDTEEYSEFLLSTQRRGQFTKVTAMCSSSCWYAQHLTMRMSLFNRCKSSRRSMEDM